MSVSPVSDLRPARIAELCGAERFGHTVVLLETAGSTNRVASIAAAAGVPEGTVIIAARQTAGRGRCGRSWFSSEAGALLFSLVLRPRRESGSLTVLLALAAAETLQAIVGGAMIKWPNDIWVGGRKVAGILAEAGAGAVVLGMGINVNENEASFPSDLGARAVSLRMLAGEVLERDGLLAKLLRRFGARYGDWERFGFERLRPEVEGLLLWRGERVSINTGAEVEEGVLLGLSADGRLRLGLASGELIVAAGDLGRARTMSRRAGGGRRKDIEP